MQTEAEKIIDLIDGMPDVDQQQVAAAFKSGYVSCHERPRNWHRVAHLRVECDGECEAAMEADDRANRLDGELDAMADDRDLMQDERDDALAESRRLSAAIKAMFKEVPEGAMDAVLAAYHDALDA